MVKFFNFFKKKSWLLILVACLIFIPQSFSYQAKLNMRVLVSGLAIDKKDQSYEVTAQVIMPTAGSEGGGMGARLDFISETGESVAEGIQKIAYKIGKTAGLSHMSFVIVGESMLEDNLATALDFFARDAQVNPSAMLLLCDGSAKEMIKQTKNLELSVGVGLQKVFIYKQGSLNGLVMPMEAFINNAFSFAKSSVVSGIQISPEGEENSSGQTSSGTASTSDGSSSSSGGGSSSGSGGGSTGGGQGGSSGSEEKNVRIKFYNDIYYFKKGEYVNKLSDEKEILGVYFADSLSKSGNFKVSGVNGSYLQDATLGVQITNKKTRRKIKFINGKPVMVIDIKIKDVQIIEILNKDRPSTNIYDRQNKELNKIFKDSISEEIKQCIKMAFDKAKSDNVDIFDIGERAYQTKTKEWKDYYNKHGENYLKNIEIEVNVSIRNVN